MRKLAVVGIGPGNYENMTIRADRALRECDVIVGYTVYVDLVKERYADKEFLTTPMLREVERCEMALETARGGKTVAMICSGDSGIYGMAALGKRRCSCLGFAFNCHFRSPFLRWPANSPSEYLPGLPGQTAGSPQRNAVPRL